MDIDNNARLSLWNIDNMANFIYQTRNAPKAVICNSNNHLILEYLKNEDGYDIKMSDSLKGITYALSLLFDDIGETEKIDDLIISHSEYDTPYLKQYLNERFNVSML